MRREVRTTTQFWAALDHELPAGSSPSWHDFAAIDLPVAVEKLATGWDEMAQLIPGRPDYRVLIDTGQIAAYSIEAQIRRDGAIELLGITVDLSPPWLDDPNEPSDD